MNTILIIDDSEADLYYDEMILEGCNHSLKLLTATDGIAALDLLETLETDPNLILLDINMPRLNGHGFLEKFTKSNQRDIPVVVMLTSSDQEQDKEKAFSYKCVKDYLVKPITEEKVDKVLGIVKSCQLAQAS